jgi:hypothetical protein
MNPETRIYIGFDLTSLGGDFFTLDDEIKGLLDNATYTLGGTVMVDVTNYAVSVSINRGKSRELDRFNAGSANITFNNDDRTFDPFYVSSPYYGQILPRKQVLIESNGINQFTGFIDDWNLDYELGGKSYASISCFDGFAQLAATELSSFSIASQKSGPRIASVLNRSEVGWPKTLRSIEFGQQTLQSDTIPENTNVLQYLQLIEASEPGTLFIDKSGKVTFKDRINIPPTGDIIFADDDRLNSVSYTNIEVVYGSENLYNRAVITREGGTAQTANDTDSQAIYGVQSFSQDGLLMNTDANALILAEYIVGKYSQPELRFSKLKFTLHDKSGTDQSNILNLEINDMVQIVFSPNGVGDPIDRFEIITGISHNIGIATHEIEFSFGALQGLPFVLNSNLYGVLDQNTISF